MVGVLLGTSALLMLDKIDGVIWRDVVIALCAAYFVANVVQHHKSFTN